MREASVPVRVAVLPPGPELAAALADLQLASVPNDQIVDVVQAQARQLAHDQARLLAAMVELSRTVPGTTGPLRRDEPFAWAAGELAAALTLTTRTAERELVFADAIVTSLPLVFHALCAGRLDRAKAWVFADHLRPETSGLQPDQVAAICARLVPPAAGWTTGQLSARLLRAIIAVDPEHARRRYQKAVREREVIGYLDDAGTVTITATGLPADQAAAAYARLEDLAAAVKRAGHPGRLAHIKAEVFIGLLDGRYHHATTDQITTDLLTRTDTTASEPTEADHPAEPTVPTGPAEEAEPTKQAEPTKEAEPTEEADPTEQAHPAGSSEEAANPGSAPDSGLASGEESGTSGDTGVAVGTAVGSSTPCDEPGPVEEVRTGVEIRVGLSTLLGLDEHPGEIPGLGPVIAPVARDLVAAQHRGAQWRYAITDTEGYLLLAGTTRRRPRHPRPGRCRGGIVEIHLPATLLHRLTADPATADDWADVVADITAQYARRDELATALDARPTTRYVRGALARHVQIRDRTCTHPGCRCPAVKADLDHTHDHALGGLTTTTNTGPGCGRHHLYKTELGWHLHQPRPGHFYWTSPLGRTYHTRGEPITPPLPEPAPGPEPDPRAGAAPADLPDEQPTILRPPPPDGTPHGPPSDDPEDEPPPF